MAIRKRAKRMSPVERRTQILDSAVGLILAKGLSNCTLEQVAAAAGISKPLIYKYFSKRDDLLKTILEREFNYLRGRGLNALPRGIPFEQVVRLAVERSTDYLYERGPIMRLIASDRAIAALVLDRDRDERAISTKYFVNRAVATFGVPEDVAQVATIMTVNAPIHSTRALMRRNIEAKRTAEVWSEFILGGWHALEARFRTRRTPPLGVTGRAKRQTHTS